MADKNDPWRRFRDRSLGKGAEVRKSLNDRRQSPGASTSVPGAEVQAGTPAQEIQQILDQVPSLLDQLNHLYNMYIAGVERRAPIERRKHLESIQNQLVNMNKPTSSLKFKSSAMVSHIQAHCEKWDKLMRGLENGTIKRRKQGGKPGSGSSGGSSDSSTGFTSTG